MTNASPAGKVLPSDVWWRIMAECGPYEARSLAQCCREFRDLAGSRSIWLRCIQNLGPHEAPSIPKHIPLESLPTPDLRCIAINAHRRYLNWHNTSSPKVKRKTIISLKDANPDEVLGEPVEFGLQLFLLPGGEYLLIYWPAGYLQCWSVQDETCLWVYPDLPEGASEDRPKLLWTFDYEVQDNGDVHLLLIDERLQGDEMGDMYLTVVQFSRGRRSLTKLYTDQRLDREYGPPVVSRSRGNLILLYQQLWGFPLGTLTILFRGEEKSLTVTGINVECLDVADGFIIYLSNLGNGSKSLNILPVLELSRAATGNGTVVSYSDVLSAAMLLETKSFSLERSQLTTNTLHWKAKADQDKIHIAVLYKHKISKGSPFARFVLNKERGQSDASIWHLLTMYSITYDEYEDNPALELNGRIFASYTTLTSLTLSGQCLVVLHTPAESEDVLALAALTEDGRMKFRPLDLGYDYHETEALCNEFYSDAVIFTTKTYDSVIIQEFE